MKEHNSEAREVELLHPVHRCFLVLSSLLIAAVWGARIGHAHDNPSQVIERLSARLQQEGSTPALLYQRATEYRVLGRLNLADKDLRSALALDPEYVWAWSELSHIYMAQNRIEAAFDAINHALSLVPDKHKADRAPLLMMRARIHVARRDDKSALTDCDEALQKHTGQIDWYLTRAQTQRRLGRLVEAALGLKQGYDATGSHVLEQEWIEALIDAGCYRQALSRIEPHLQESRWQSSWYLRRGRARLGLGEKRMADADLENAIEEINQRLSPKQPDMALLADRGLAQVLLGNIKAAQADLLTAEKLGAKDWVLWRLHKALRE